MSNIEQDVKQEAVQARLTLRQKMAARPFLVAEIALSLGGVIGLVIGRLI